jgi:hypothetical protein
MSRNITENSYTPEPMTAAEYARFHACASEPARRRIPQVIDQGVMFGQLGLADVLAESTSPIESSPAGREIMRLGNLARELAAAAPGDDARCIQCGGRFPADLIDPLTGYCPSCEATRARARSLMR